MTFTTTTTTIEARKLTVDPRLQRPLDETRVEGITNRINLHAIGQLTVSQRTDGTMVVLDGQHRLEALRRTNNNGIHVDAKLFVGLARAEEAELFELLNNTKQLNKVDLFRVRVFGEEPVAITISGLLEHFGWRVRTGAMPGSLAAIGAYETIWRDPRNGPLVAREIIATVTAAWGNDTSGVNSVILRGLAYFFFRYSNREIDPSRLATKLNAIGDAKHLRQRAKAHGQLHNISAATAAAEICVIEYNRGMPANRKLEAFR